MINIALSLTKRYPKVETLPKPILLPFFLAIQKIVHQNDINHFLKQHEHTGAFSFIESVLDYFNFSYKFSSNQIENIPASGRVVIIANHPLGALDAISLIHLVKQIRSDIKIVANDILASIEQLKPILVGVDNFSQQISKQSLRDIYQTLENEEVLIVFPAGEVSRAKTNGIKDGKWHKGFLKFALKAHAPILPIHIEAKNSTFFYTLSSLNKGISTLFLAHEMFRQKNKSLEFTIGELIPFKSFEHSTLELKTEIKLLKKHLYRLPKGKKNIFATQKSIAHPENRQLLRKELRNSIKLGETKDGKIIYLYEYEKGSIVLQEISRLREYTFRKVEEGTGKKRDKDSYDYHYKHIILWDENELEIAGSYRIAQSNEIYANYDLEGFYTHSLFNFNSNFKPYLNNSIELGRSFVQPKYWGSRALDYLWQGIGAYLNQNPHIRYMFGAVTLSSSFAQNAQELILYYYDKHYGKNHHCLNPKKPFKFSEKALEDLNEIFIGKNAKEDFLILKDQLSYYGVTVPTLYKQYADLCDEGGIAFMGYNIDKEFNNAIDSFIVVDIEKIKAKKKERYFR